MSQLTLGGLGSGISVTAAGTAPGVANNKRCRHKRWRVCLFHPGARDSRRRWPSENFAVVADTVARAGYHIVLTGSEQERSLLQAPQEQIKAPALNIVESFGHLGICELAALLSRAKLLVSNDTGVSHVAAAIKLRSVIFFSQHSDLNRWRPLDTTLHIAIPWECASDVEFVTQCVTDMRKVQKPASTQQRLVANRLPR